MTANDRKWASRTDAQLEEMRDLNRRMAEAASREDDHRAAKQHGDIAAYCQHLLAQRGG